MNYETQATIALVAGKLLNQESQSWDIQGQQGTFYFETNGNITPDSINIKNKTTGSYVQGSGSSNYFSQIRIDKLGESFSIQVAGSNFSGKVNETGESFVGYISGDTISFQSPDSTQFYLR